MVHLAFESTRRSQFVAVEMLVFALDGFSLLLLVHSVERVDQAEHHNEEDHEEVHDQVGDVSLLLKISVNIFQITHIIFFVLGLDLGAVVRSVSLGDAARSLIHFPLVDGFTIYINLVITHHFYLIVGVVELDCDQVWRFGSVLGAPKLFALCVRGERIQQAEQLLRCR